MNAEVRHVKTNAEQALTEAFASAKRSLPGDGGIAALREAAFGRFEAIGLPNRRVEEWKYTDLRGAMRDAKPIATAPDSKTKDRARDAGRIIGDVDVRRIVFVEGILAPDLSDLGNLSPGLSIRSMAAALAAGDPLIAAHLDRVVPSEREAVIALNTALMHDGVLIHVAAGATVDRPIQIGRAHV